MNHFWDIALSLLTLMLLEAVLGIDNLVFLVIVSNRLPADFRRLAQKLGLTLAWVMRLIILALAIELTHLNQPLFTLFQHSFSIKALFLLSGGLFLLFKATQEIHAEFDKVVEKEIHTKAARFIPVVMQIVLLDIVFSLDSVLTAVGLTSHFWVMATAITFAILIMLFASQSLSRFIETHPSIKMLAFSFLMLIGMSLIAEGLGFIIPKAYLYFAIGFSFFVEILNLIKRRQKK